MGDDWPLLWLWSGISDFHFRRTSSYQTRAEAARVQTSRPAAKNLVRIGKSRHSLREPVLLPVKINRILN